MNKLITKIEELMESQGLEPETITLLKMAAETQRTGKMPDMTQMEVKSLDARRQESKRIIDRLSTGERFMLLFGRGKVERDPLRVVPKTTPTNS